MVTNNIINPSVNYPNKLTDKELKKELDGFIHALKQHNPENGLMDTLNYYAAMVNTGYLEQQKRGTSKGSKWSIVLGVITTLAALVSIGISIHATNLSQEASKSTDINQSHIFNLEKQQIEVLNTISLEIIQMKTNTETLTTKNPNQKSSGGR